MDELYKIFMDSDSFYYSMTYDLTNSVQRQGELDKSSIPLWKQVWIETHIIVLCFFNLCSWGFFKLHHNNFYSLEKVDDRFFWNKHMIQDLLDLQVNVYCFSSFYRIVSLRCVACLLCWHSSTVLISTTALSEYGNTE